LFCLVLGKFNLQVCITAQTIIFSGKEIIVFQKLTPLIVLAMFAAGAYFMIKGMHHASKVHQAKPAKKPKIEIIKQ